MSEYEKKKIVNLEDIRLHQEKLCIYSSEKNESTEVLPNRKPVRLPE